MKTIAIDSSLAAGSVAAASAGRVTEIRLPEAGEHARRIAAAVDEAARSLGWAPGEAELIAVVRGPGSFTGLRVGVATAKALAWAAAAKLVAVSGFAIIARRSALALGREGPIHVAYDAGRGDLFVAEAAPAADRAGGWQVGAPRLVPGREWLASLPGTARVSGPALASLADPAGRIGDRPDLVVAPREAWLPVAGEVAALAALTAAAGDFVEPAALVPDYMRPSYAQEASPAGARLP